MWADRAGRAFPESREFSRELKIFAAQAAARDVSLCPDSSVHANARLIPNGEFAWARQGMAGSFCRLAG
jgi:hypothetical protein